MSTHPSKVLVRAIASVGWIICSVSCAPKVGNSVDSGSITDGCTGSGCTAPLDGSTATCTGTATSLAITPATVTFGATTLQEATTSTLVTVMNTGSDPLAIGAVAISGANAGDFTEQTDCPTSLPAGDACYVRVAFDPTATGDRVATLAINGACTSALTGSGIALADGFYLSPDGDDTAGDGSLGSPWKSLPKAQSAMRASGGAKLTTYLRAGVYAPTAIPNCAFGSYTCGLEITNADAGETWTYYPPDGIDSAIVTGGSTGNGTGLSDVIYLGGASNVTIDGLTVQDFGGSGIGGVNSNHITVKNNIVFNGYGTGGYGAQAISCSSQCQNWSIVDNVMHDVTGGGANVVSGTNGNISNLVYAGNFVYNTCTLASDGGDCGALYVQDNIAQSTNISITGNFVRDGNPFRGTNSGSAIYLDDCLSNATVTGNIVTGTNGANTTFIHGGKNDVYAGNIIDLGNYGQHISTLQTSGSSACNVMTGNKYTGNIIISADGGGLYNDLSYPLPANPTIENNLYFNYGGTTIVSKPDTAPTVVDPKLSGCYTVDPASPAWAAPFSFSPLARNWGPPDFVMPAGATVPPSYPSPTCN